MKSFPTPSPLTSWDPWPFDAAVAAIYKARLDRMRYHRRLTEHDQSRDGWVNLVHKFPLHPTVRSIVDVWRPHDWQLLLLEWPHVSTTDPTRLAYSRDMRALKDDRQTITTVGKYIKRHWPTMPDHMIRDYVALNAPDRMEIWTTMEEIICSIELGPRSCMKSTWGSIPFHDDDRADLEEWFSNGGSTPVAWYSHPYSVYDPALGWAAAVRYSPQNPAVILGRAIVHLKDKRFVRTYCRSPKGEEAYSDADHALAAWLVQQGFTHADRWRENTKFRYVEHPDGEGESDECAVSSFMMPYIDGSCRRVETDYDNGKTYIVLTEHGEWLCENTDGYATSDGERYLCDDCGGSFDEEDLTYVGRVEDERVCFRCLERHYVYVQAEGYRGTRSYYLPAGDAAEVLTARGTHDYYIDRDHVPNGVVYCEEDETYRREDDCFSYEGEYYLYGDGWEDADGEWYPDFVESITYDGQKYHKDYCWQCAGTGLWYPDYEDYITDDDGNTYHPDYTARISSDAEDGDDGLVILRTQFEEYDKVHVPLPTQLIPATSPESVELAHEIYA